MPISCKLADFGLARSLSQNHPTVDSNGNEETCLTDYVGNAYRFSFNTVNMYFSMKSRQPKNLTDSKNTRSLSFSHESHLKCEANFSNLSRAINLYNGDEL